MTTDRKSKTIKEDKEVSLVSSVLSITSALPNWNAVYFEDDGSVWFEPIACYALCEKYDAETGKKYKFVGSVVSQDTNGLTIAEDANNFLGISPPNETEIEWAELAANKLGISSEESDDEESDDEESDDEESDDEESDDEEEVVEVVPRTRRRNLR